MRAWMLVTILLAGCAPRRLYDGEARPETEIALITLVTSQDLALWVPDARSEGHRYGWKTDRTIEVLPGRYSWFAEVRWTSRQGGLTGLISGAIAASVDPGKSVSLEFRVERGRNYEMEVHWIDDRYYYSVRDIDSGELVAGVPFTDGLWGPVKVDTEATAPRS